MAESIESSENPYEAAVLARRGALAKRPNGSVLLLAGWLLAAAGALAILTGIIMPTFSDPGHAAIGDIVSAVPPTFNVWKWPLIYLGSCAISLATLTIALGVVVRAMFFLPGRDVTSAELDPTSV